MTTISITLTRNRSTESPKKKTDATIFRDGIRIKKRPYCCHRDVGRVNKTAFERHITLENGKIIYLVSDDFGVEFETFGKVKLAERRAQLTHHFQLGPHLCLRLLRKKKGNDNSERILLLLYRKREGAYENSQCFFFKLLL